MGERYSGSPENIPGQHSGDKLDAHTTGLAETRDYYNSTTEHDESSAERRKAGRLVMGLGVVAIMAAVIGYGTVKTLNHETPHANRLPIISAAPPQPEISYISPTPERSRGPIEERPAEGYIEIDWRNPPAARELADALSANFAWAANHPEDTQDIFNQTFQEWGEPLGYEPSKQAMLILQNNAAHIVDTNPTAYFTVSFEWNGEPKHNELGAHQYYGPAYLHVECIEEGVDWKPLHYEINEILVEQFKIKEGDTEKDVMKVSYVEIESVTAS